MIFVYCTLPRVQGSVQRHAERRQTYEKDMMTQEKLSTNTFIQFAERVETENYYIILSRRYSIA